MTDDLRGRVVVVTGATRGIGLGVARHLGSRGARVVITGRREPGVSEASDALDAIGVEHLAAVADVADRDAMVAIVDEAAERWGR